MPEQPPLPSDADPFWLIDGSSYLYRAYHALPSLTNPDGQPAGAVYGVIQMVRKLIRQYQPPYLVVVLDSAGKTFRHTLYPDYKANRPAMPEDLRGQWHGLCEGLDCMGVDVLFTPGVEADDLIATWAQWAARAGHPVVVVSGDKDLLQLVSPQITVIDTMSRKTYDREAVYQKWGVYPEQFADFLALMGDTIDHIPGVPGVGPKTAAKWLQTYGTLAGLLEAAPTLSGKIGEKLRAHQAHLPLALELVTLRPDPELAVQTLPFVRRTPDPMAWPAWLETWGFQSLLNNLDAGSAKTEPTADPAKLGSGETPPETAPFAWSMATHWVIQSGPPPTAGTPEGSAASATKRPAPDRVGMCWMIYPMQVGAQGEADRIGPPLTWSGESHPEWAAWYAKYQPIVVGHDLKSCWHQWQLVGFPIDPLPTGRYEDTRLMDHVLHTVPTGSQPEAWLQVANRLGISEPTLPRLYQVLRDALQACPSVQAVYASIEKPLVPILCQMEATGVLVDVAVLHAQGQAADRQIHQIVSQAHAAVGRPFNLDSPKQVRDILFGQENCPILEKTPKGEPSTNERVLQLLAPQYPLASLLLQHRTWMKLKTTYLDKLPACVHPKTGRLHARFDQAGTVTGRFSCADPNLQNIPIRTEAGRRIREAFVARPGWWIVACDYSQIELRIMAHVSGDPQLRRAFETGQDIHQQTAAEIFHMPLDQVTPEARRAAKAINFGLIYGMSAFGLAAQLGVDREAAQAYLERYFAKYPGVKAYMEATEQQARAQGYVETIFGRRLYLPDLRSPHGAKRRAAVRAAINAPLQGSAADIIKKAMVAVAKRLDPEQAVLVMQVHDELVFEVHGSALVDFQPVMVHTMQHAVALSVPLVVHAGVGHHWGAAH